MEDDTQSMTDDAVYACLELILEELTGVDLTMTEATGMLDNVPEENRDADVDELIQMVDDAEFRAHLTKLLRKCKAMMIKLDAGTGY